MKKLLEIVIVSCISCVVAVLFPAEMSAGYEYGAGLGDRDVLEIVNPESHPKTGNIWEIQFLTEGVGDLVITLEDAETVEDIEFKGLTCGVYYEYYPLTVSEGVGVVRDYQCEGVSVLRYLVHKAGNHAVGIEYGGEKEVAHNSGIFQWAKRLGGADTENDNGYEVAVDSLDNIIIAGAVSGSADLNGDGDAADGDIESVGYGLNDVFVTIFDSSGTYQWAKRLGGASTDQGLSVAVDSLDTIVLTGNASGVVDLNGDGDAADGDIESVGYGDRDVFISVFNSSGTHLWAKRLGGTSTDNGYGVAVDSSNNVVVTGSIGGDADLNGDGDVTDGGAESAVGYGSYDAFITVFDSSGTHLWAKRLGGTVTDNGYDVVVTTSNNIVVTGRVSGSADFNGDGDCIDGVAESSGYGGADGFITVFDSSGTHLWAKRLGGLQTDTGFFVSVDSLDTIVLTGWVSGSADLNGDGDTTDGGAESAVGYGGYDAFITVFNSSGSYQWAKRLGGTAGDYGYSVAVVSSDNIVVTGYVTGDVDLNGDGDSTDGGAESAVGYGGDDAFITVFDSSGTHQLAERLGGTSSDLGYSVAVDSSDNIVVTGYVSGDADLNGDRDSADGGAESAVGYGGTDVFVAVFAPDTVAPVMVSADPVSGSSVNDPTLTIGLELDDFGDCRLSLTDQSYDDMADDIDCTGDGTANISCTTPDMGEDGVKQVYVSCQDNVGNKHTALDNFELSYTLDRVLPVPSGFNPSSGSTITTNFPTITFSLDENGDCRAGTADESYADMADDVDCTGDGTQLMTCSMENLGLNGAKSVYVSCQDSPGNQDTVDSNENLVYTLVDGTQPEISDVLPESGSDLTDYTPEVTFATNEPATCRLSFEDESYAGMSDDILCSAGGGGTSHVCETPDLGVFGNRVVYLSCTDVYGNGDTRLSNTEVVYTLIPKEGVYFEWAKRLGGTNYYDNGYSVAVDSSNNVVVTGSIDRDADLNGDGDAADGGAESKVGYGDQDAFISFFDSSGTHLWAKRLGGTADDYGYSVAVDSLDNIVVTGWVTGAADLNGDGDATDGGAESAIGYGNNDVFISVFDSSGTHLWAKRLGGTRVDYGYSVAVDSLDNIVVTGDMYGSADLNGDGDAADGGTESAVGYGYYDVFISVFDSSGSHLWAKRLGGTSTDYGYSVAVDSLDNIVVTGHVAGDADLNGDGDAADGGMESAMGYGSYDVFTTVFDSSGTHLWAKRLGGTSDDYGYGVTVDSLDNIVVTGCVNGAADLNGDGDRTDGGLESAFGYGYHDVFISVFDSSGTHLWAKRLGGTSDDYGYGVTADSLDNIVVTGYVYGDVDLNGDGDSTDGGAESAVGYGGDDAYITVFNSSGTHLWARRLGGTSDDYGYGVTVDSLDNIVVTGYVTGDADLNGDGDSTDGGAESAVGYGSYDVFISVFRQDLLSPTGGVVISGGSALTNSQSVSLNISATDSLSDVREMMICNTVLFTGCTWEPYRTSREWELSGGDGTKAVYVKFKDGVGNVSESYSDTIVLDTVLPVGGVEISWGSIATGSRNVSLGISATDVTTDVAEMMVCNAGTFTGCVWDPYQTTKEWELTEGEGTKTVYVKFKDRAGNVSVGYSDSIVLDTTSPEVSIRNIDGYPLVTLVRWLINGRPVFSGTTEPNTVIRVDVASAGISDWLTSDSEGNWRWQPGSLLPLGIHEVVVTAWDTAGNGSSDSVILVVLLSFGSSVDAGEEEGLEGEDQEDMEEKDEEGEEDADGGESGGRDGFPVSGGEEVEEGAGGGFVGWVLGSITDAIDRGSRFVSSVMSSTTERIQEVNRSTLGEVSAMSLLTVAAVTGGAEVAAVAGTSVMHIPLMFTQVFIGGLFGVSRRRKPWGVVYDSVTKDPLSRAVVRIYRGEELVETTVTDVNGVFMVDLEEGTYTVEAEKGSYVFPSELVSGDSDGMRGPIYRGGAVMSPKGGKALSMYVPLDPEGAREGGRLLVQARSLWSSVLGLAVFGVLVLGTIFSVWSFLVVGGVLYLVLMALSMLMLVFNVYIRVGSVGGWGKVETEGGEPVSGLEIGLYDYSYGRMIDNRVTDEEGRYRFIVSGGRYWIRPVGTEYVLVNYTGKGGIEVGEETDRELVLSEKLVVRKVGSVSS